MHAKVIVLWKVCSRQICSYFKMGPDKSILIPLLDFIRDVWSEDKGSLSRDMTLVLRRYSGGALSKDR